MVLDSQEFCHPNEPPLSDLFNKRRFLPFCRSYILLVCWFPFGIILGLLRMILFPLMYMPLCSVFIFFHKENLLWKTIGKYVFGINTVLKNEQHFSNCPIVVSNHQTDFDGIGVMPVLGCGNMIGLTSKFLLPLARFSKLAHLPLEIIIRETDPERKHETKEKIEHALGKTEDGKKKLFVMPEGATTNGKIGLLMYNKFIFSLGRSIQPLALRVRSHLPINIDKPSRNMFPNFFFLFFCPFVTFEFHALPAQMIREGETPEAFARRVQQITADYLGVACTTYSYKDKNNLRKVIR